MFNEFTSYIDFAQVSLYIFWFFFAGLVFWLRKEDRREGYPLESDNPRRVGATTNFLIPEPKTFVRPDGSVFHAPDFERDERPVAAQRTAQAPGAALEPTGDPLADGVGPAAYAVREHHPELTREGHIAIVPMRNDTDYSINAGPDPRGFSVVGADGKVAGKVTDVWIDRAEMIARYLEVSLGEGEAVRLLPVNSGVIRGERGVVEVTALHADHLFKVPATESPDQITIDEEERIGAFYAGGLLYASPERLGPVV